MNKIQSKKNIKRTQIKIFYAFFLNDTPHPKKLIKNIINFNFLLTYHNYTMMYI
jgi:hypothetical protein